MGQPGFLSPPLGKVVTGQGSCQFIVVKGLVTEEVTEEEEEEVAAKTVCHVERPGSRGSRGGREGRAAAVLHQF